MANACSLTCNTLDNDGKVKVSELWKELGRFMKQDRRKMLAHYFLTKDNNFLIENRNILEFDVNGEVTIESLKKALDSNGEYADLSDNLVLQQLNNELGGKRYDYSTALEEVLKFNKSGKFNDGFMASLRAERDGKYTIEVNKRTDEAELELAHHVQNKIITEAIRTMLKDKGLSVDFLDNPNYAIQYDSANAEKDPVTGLYSVINVLNGINTSAEVAEAAGHFIVEAMINSPLVQRLMSQLTPDVQKALLKDKDSPLHRQDFIVTDSETSAREAAGILIGYKLTEPFKNAQLEETPLVSVSKKVIDSIKWILKKIGDSVKKLFGMYDPNDIGRLASKAMDAAATAAYGYINNASNVSGIEDILNSDDGKSYSGVSIKKRLSDEVRNEVFAYNEMLDKLKSTTSTLKKITSRNQDSSYEEIQKMLEDFASTVDSSYSPFVRDNLWARQASLSGIATMVAGMTELLDTKVRKLLDDIQPANRASAYSNIAQNARNMRALNHIVLNIAQMHKIISSELESLHLDDPAMVSINGQVIADNLQNYLNQLGAILVGNTEKFVNSKGVEVSTNGLQGVMELKRRQVFLDAYRDFYGDDYIEISAGRVFENYKLVAKSTTNPSVDEFLETLMNSDEDISWFDRYISSAADSGDFFTSVGRMTTGLANANADRIAFSFFDRIVQSEMQMRELFGDTNWLRLLETTTDSEGRTVKTGNFVNKDNYGEWEKALQEKQKEIRAEFYKELEKHREDQYKKNKGVKGYSYYISDIEKGVLYHTVKDRMMKDFHKENSVKDNNGRWRPNPKKYHSTQWDELFDTENPALTQSEKDLRRRRLKWYTDFMDIKAGEKDGIDSLLPNGATSKWRVPQFTGRSKHIYRNLKETYGNNTKTLGYFMRRKLANLKDLKNDEAWKFGCDNDFNNISDDPLENASFHERGKIDRLPIYGVNKLTNMEELSTDIFGSMVRYASMAATYNCMEEVADIFEIGKDVLKKRAIKSLNDGKSGYVTTLEEDKHGESRAYSRYIRFVEKNVYNYNIDPILWDPKGTKRKFISTLASFGGQILLYGNFHGGIVNTGTGLLEIWKEAVAGENFTTDELKKAVDMYFSDILATAGNGLIDSQVPQNRNSLFIRHWNVLSENKDFFNGTKFDVKAMSLIDNRLIDWFGNTMMLPYSSGEHMMQTIPYYAMGYHTKVYDIDGKEMSLIDAYDIVDGKEVFAIEAETDDDALGKTPKKVQLKDNIFKSAENVNRYKTTTDMLGRMQSFLNNHPNLNDQSKIDPSSIFTDEHRKLLESFGFATPLTKKQLNSLKTALEIKQKELKFGEADEMMFMEKCRNINNRMHGIYNQEDRVALQQNFYGSLVTSMRGYALGMMNRRYADSRFNPIQRKVVEGSSVSAAKVLLGLIGAASKDLTGSYNLPAYLEATAFLVPGFNLLLFNNRYSNMVKADMQKAGFSANQYYNVRRAGADYLVIETLWLLKFLTGPGRHFGLFDDEDEDGSRARDVSDNVAVGILYYFFNRWLAEQSAFNTGYGFYNDSTQLLDYIPVGLSGAKAMWDIASLAAKTWVTDDPNKENSELYYQSTKEGKYKYGDAKWLYKLKRLTPYYRSIYTFTHPYDSASGWEYGRKVRAK